MTKLQKEICRKFHIQYKEGWISLRCVYPDHDDKHPSAALCFDSSQWGGWYQCKGCKKNETLVQLLHNIGKQLDEENDTEDIESIDVEDIENVETILQPNINLLGLIEDFLNEKGLEMNTLTELGAYPSDEGYLVFEYGLTRRRKVGRYLGRNKHRPRFLQEKGDKGLFGEENIPHNDIVYLVEGLTDYLSMYQLGYKNIVCSFGAELSEEQAYLLLGKTVFILYDLDYAGYKGALQAEERIKELNGNPIILKLYQHKLEFAKYIKSDVNELIKRDPERFQMWLDQSIQRYVQNDSQYVDTFVKREVLKHYNTSFPVVKFTRGLYVFTGEPGAGKTTLGVCLLDAFIHQGARVLYCNYDLPKDQILARLASRYSQFSWEEIETDPSIMESSVIRQLKLSLENGKVENGLSASEIKHAMRYFDCLIVDYLQQIPATDTDPRIAIEKNLAILSPLSSNNGKTIVCISRMPASAFGKNDGHVFAGSAAIEYNAQAAVLLSKDDDNHFSANVIKNTRGKVGVRYFKIDYPHQRVEITNLKEIAKEVKVPSYNQMILEGYNDKKN